MDPVRYAIVGYGLAGSAFHAPVIAAIPGADLAAVVARSRAARDAVNQRYPGVPIVADAAELTGLGIDVAVVATPNATHAQLAGELLSAGIAVVVDKPLAPDAASGAELVAQSRSTGISLTCYQNRRWDGDFRTVRRLQSEGALGRIHRFESRFERWRPQVAAGWKEQVAPGSGVLFDLGPHVIDQAIQLLGPVASSHGWSRTVRKDAVVADDAFVELRHDSGAVSHLSVSHVAAAPGPRFRVLGTEAAYVKTGLDPQEAALRAGNTPGGPDWGREPESDWGRLWRGGSSEPVPTEAGDYPEFYRLMTEHVRGNVPVPVEPTDSLRGLEIIEAVSRAP